MVNAIFSPGALAILGLILMSVMVITAPKEDKITAETIFQSALNQGFSETSEK